MPRFSYLALDTSGEEVRGLVDGPSADWVSQRLALDALIPVEIDHTDRGYGTTAPLRQHLPVSVADLALFSSQFALLLDTGLPIVGALGMLTESTTKPKLRAALREATERHQGGASLHDALAPTGQFPALFLHLVRAAESRGTLVGVLQQLSTYLQHEADLRGRLREALLYPLFLLALGTTAMACLMIVVLPPFTEFFAAAGAELPWPTSALLATSTLVAAHWPWILLGALALGCAARLLLRHEGFRLRLDGLALAIPGWGSLHSKSSLAQLTFVLGSLLEGGLPIVEALDVAGRSCGNRKVRRAVARAREEIVRGTPIAEALTASGAMPVPLLQMVSIGEVTGHLDRVLLRVSEIYDQQVARTTNALLRLVEPALIAAFAGSLGFVVIALVLPMLEILASYRS